ncbi:MAG TPA: hypothetical protein PKD05_16870 [Candidatus Melainabacteria bacterium]|nr:hypothetical protein [Candidatus Melainabacteria bacterium]
MSKGDTGNRALQLPGPSEKGNGRIMLFYGLSLGAVALLFLLMFFYGGHRYSLSFPLFAAFHFLFMTFFIWYFSGAFLQGAAAMKLLSTGATPDYLGQEIYFRKLRQALKVLPVRKDPHLTYLNLYIAYAQRQQGKHEQGLDTVTEDDIKLISSKAMRYPYLVVELISAAASLYELDQYDLAMEKLKEAGAICKERKEKDRHAQIYVLTIKALVLARLELYEESDSLSREALKYISEMKKLPLWMMPVSVEQYRFTNLVNLATLSILTGDLDKIELQIMQLEAAFNKDKKIISPFHFTECIRLSEGLKKVDRLDLAQTVLGMIYGVASSMPGHPAISRLLDTYQEVLELSGRQDDVSTMRAWLLPINH